MDQDTNISSDSSVVCCVKHAQINAINQRETSIVNNNALFAGVAARYCIKLCDVTSSIFDFGTHRIGEPRRLDLIDPAQMHKQSLHCSHKQIIESNKDSD